MNPVSTTPIPELGAGTYRLDPERSTVSYSGKHMFGLGTVHATFAIRNGELRVTEPLSGSTVSAVIDAASFSSGNAKRDRDVLSSGLLDVAQYPDIAFESRALRREDNRLLMDGHVTAHGTSVPVQVTVTAVEVEADGIRIHATAQHLDRHAFGITGGRGMVGRHLDLDLDVLATATP